MYFSRAADSTHSDPPPFAARIAVCSAEVAAPEGRAGTTIAPAPLAVPSHGCSVANTCTALVPSAVTIFTRTMPGGRVPTIVFFVSTKFAAFAPVTGENLSVTSTQSAVAGADDTLPTCPHHSTVRVTPPEMSK